MWGLLHYSTEAGIVRLQSRRFNECPFLERHAGSSGTSQASRMLGGYGGDGRYFSAIGILARIAVSGLNTIAD